MRKFFFDDVRASPGDDWEVARDVPQARYLLENCDYDVWALDHDIGMQMLCEKCNMELWIRDMDISGIAFKEAETKFQDGCIHYETGTALVKWAIETLTKWPQLVIIHSSNPWGSARMKGLLEPFVPNIQIIPYRNVLWNTIKEN